MPAEGCLHTGFLAERRREPPAGQLKGPGGWVGAGGGARLCGYPLARWVPTGEDADR